MSGGILHTKAMDPYTGNEELDTLVRERMDTLAPEVKRVFDDPASSIYIESFAASAGLDVEKTEGLKHEIILMMLGFTPADDFSFVLMTELEMPPRQAFAVEHWVKGVFLKEVMPYLVSSQGSAVSPEAPSPVLPEVSPAPVAVSAPAPTPEPVVLEPQEEPLPEPALRTEPEAAPVYEPEPVQAPEREAPQEVALVAPVIPTYTAPVPAPVPPPSAPMPAPHPVAATPLPVAQPAVTVPKVMMAPPLPKAMTPLPIPTKQIPAIPSSAPTLASMLQTSSTPKPRTMLEDVARARGAITPEGIARYDRPLAQTPSYAK